MRLSNDSGFESSAGEEDSDPASRRPVDLVHLAKYTLGDRSAEREILEIFSRQADLCLKRLRSAETVEAWKTAAHTILGSARGVGAWQVAKCAAALQEMTTVPPKTKRDVALSGLKSHISEARAFIHGLLGDA